VSTKPQKYSRAGDYLDQAVSALHACGSSDMLYGHGRTSTSVAMHTMLRLEAPARRFGYARTAILFAAIAAEAYVNAFILEPGRFTTSDAKALERLATVDKFALAPRLSGHDVFDRGKEPMTSLKSLFDLRNALVHPWPEAFEPASFEEPHGFARINPEVAARLIVGVAHGALRLTGPPFGQDDQFARWYYDGRTKLLAYGRRARSSLANATDPPEDSLWRQLDIGAEMTNRTKKRRAQ
jgi:hypothetical protein